MKLIFKKDSNGDIKTQIQTGTVLSDFSYTEMIKQLLHGSEIEVDHDDLDEDEKAKIDDMLHEIKNVFHEQIENDDEEFTIEDLL